MTAELSTSPQSQPLASALTTESQGTPTADLTIITESYRCQYPSKRCTNERSTKRDGDLHKLCEWHRSKANRNQRKLEQKKKIEARSNRAISGRSPRVRNRRQRTLSTNSTASISVNEDEDEFADEHATWEFLEELDDQDLHALGCLVDASSISL